METPQQSQFLEGITPQVAAIAAAGLRLWRTKPVDVPLLCSLSAVQAQVDALGPEGSEDADAQRDAVELALKTAIVSLPHPFYEAANEHFGLTDTDLDAKPLAKGKREEKAALHLGRTTLRWYTEPCSEYGGMTPSTYIIALVACALCGISDPPAYLGRERNQHDAGPREAEAPVPDDKPSTESQPLPGSLLRPRRRRRSIVFMGFVGLTGLVIYLASGSAGSPSRARSAKIGGYTPARRAVFRCIRKPECPGPNYPVFNSYTNAPNYGDERDFINVRRLHGQTWNNDLAVTSGEEVILRIYYDNDGDPRSEPQPGASTARNTRITVILPHARNREMDVAANITASNSRPRTLGDAVILRSTKPFNLIYMPHTAYLWNRAYPNGFALPNDLLDTGTLIGYEKMNGSITGCFCQSGLITLHLLVE